MTWAGLDQRAFPRVSARCDISISSGRGKTIRAETQNLGAGGACVILNQQLEKLSQVHLRFSLDQPKAPIDCDGRIVWMVRSKEPASGKTTFDIGIEFLNLKPEDQELITLFSQRHA